MRDLEPDKLASLMPVIEEAVSAMARNRSTASEPDRELSESMRRELESLGYLDTGGDQSDAQAAGVTFSAVPNPVPACDGSGVGTTTLSWTAPRRVEIRLGSAAGKVVAERPAVGTLATGKWVNEGMRFVLVDYESKGQLAETSVQLTFAGCS